MEEKNEKRKGIFPIELAVAAFAMAIVMMLFVYSLAVEDNWISSFMNNQLCDIEENNENVREEVVEFCENRK